MSDRIAQGEGLEPHGSNPRSTEDDARAAMEEATKKAEEAEKEAAEEPELELQPEPVQEIEEELEPLEVPTAWTADQQDVFRNAPREAQEFLLDLYEGVTQPLQQQAESLQPWQQLNQQWDPYFQKVGIPAQQLVGQLLQAEMTLRTGTPAQKQQALAGIMNAYGVVFDEEPDLSEYDDDPRMKAIIERQAQIESENRQLQSQLQQGFGQVQASQVQQANATLQAFANRVDESGKLVHPYFNEVRGLMETLAETAQRSGQQVTLEQVYEAACRAHPQVWPKIQGAERAAGMAQRNAVAADKRRASKSVSGSPAGSRTVQIKDDPNASVEDDVRAAMAAHSGQGGA